MWTALALFLIKSVFILVAIVFVIVLIAWMIRQNRHTLRVESLNDHYDSLRDALRSEVWSSKQIKKYFKGRSDVAKNDNPENKRKIYVLDFDGDINASDVSSLRESVSAILGVASHHDEVVVRLESPGGVVHGYGLAASQLLRVRHAGLRLTVCVDKVAASGGYMMACVADTVIAAPFAIVGSIGVVAQIPNVHRLLTRAGVDYEEATAGEFKRTVSFLGKISDEGRKKFQEQLEDTHGLFKEFVHTHRPMVDVTRVSTGEYWFGERALALHLVDRLQTSDDYIISQLETALVLKVHYEEPQSLRDKVVRTVGTAFEHALERMIDVSARAKFF